MQFNYEQMKEKFGIAYTYSDSFHFPKITEHFKTNLGFNYHQEDTYEKAKAKLESALKESFDNQVSMQDKLIKEFDNLGFFEKNMWRLRNKKTDFRTVATERKENIEKDYLKALNSIEFNRIDKGVSFEVSGPKILEEGETLFIVVENHNVLDLGIYGATVTRANYFARNERLIDLDGVLKIIADGKTHEFSFNTNNNEFSSCHTYHSIFTDKDEAVKYYKETIQTRIESMNKRLDDLKNFDVVNKFL